MPGICSSDYVLIIFKLMKDVIYYRHYKLFHMASSELENNGRFILYTHITFNTIDIPYHHGSRFGSYKRINGYPFE